MFSNVTMPRLLRLRNEKLSTFLQHLSKMRIARRVRQCILLCGCRCIIAATAAEAEQTNSNNATKNVHVAVTARVICVGRRNHRRWLLPNFSLKFVNSSSDEFWPLLLPCCLFDLKQSLFWLEMSVRERERERERERARERERERDRERERERARCPNVKVCSF
jgi:hypothetical protein